MRIYLLRHGQTDASGTYTGASDVELNRDGREDVGRLSSLVNKLDLQHCFCSPLRRCRQTAALLNITCKISYDESLREIDFGRWEGLSFSQISEADQPLLDQWLEQDEQFTFPGGERGADFNRRVGTWFDLLIKSNSERVLVVSHAGVIRQGLIHLLGLPPSAAFHFAIGEAALSLIARENGYSQLQFLNSRGA